MASLLGLAFICWIMTSPNEVTGEGNANAVRTPVSNQGLATKRDILGLAPGISREDLGKILETKSWRCTKITTAGPPVDTCDTELGQLNFSIAGNLPSQPLVSVRLFFKSADTDSSIAESISNQFGATSIPIKNNDGEITSYKWHLSSTLLLTFYIGQTFRYLEIFDSALDKQDSDAANALALKRNPTPKF
ncbi:MAG: hypothetical protein HY242_01910 [Afipia sp.]|nr:hypothetical protein [Afipia sp.]